MEVKKFYRTQREVAAVINEIVDEYWIDNLTDEKLDLQIKNIISYPQIMQEMGKKAEGISIKEVENKIYEQVKNLVQ